jgi:hypothetical protein
METGKLIIKDMVRKAPKPEDLDKVLALGGDDGEEETKAEEETETPKDEAGEDAAENSALSDFIEAIGGNVKKLDDAKAALKDFLGYCK